MAIFRYTFFKYLKAPSTWVILLISMFIAGFLGGYLPMSALNTKNGETVAQNYAILVIAVGGGVTAFLSIFMSVFAGFKGASMFRDEIEDGTFLVMLSKPQTRAKIIFQKWLALQMVMLLYSFLSVLSFVVFVTIFDKGSTIPSLAAIGIGTLKSSILKIGGYVWGILIVIGLIFSSIAILLSTKLSGGATVGISISLGVIIPITGMISMFTAKQEYTHIKNPTFQRMGLLLHTTAKSTPDELAKIVSLTTAQQLGKNADPKIIDNLVDKIKGDLSKFFHKMDDAYKIIDNPAALYNVAIPTGKTDKFKNIWGFDFNYQLRQMAAVVTNNMVPEGLKPQLKNLPTSKMSGMLLTSKVTGQPDKQPDTKSWINKQLEDDIRVQIKWGMDAKEVISDIVSLFEIKKTDGSAVPTDVIVDKLLTSSSTMPQSWVIPKEVREYLQQSLVQTTMQMIHKAIYDPIQSIFSSGPLFAIAPKDWQTVATTTRVKGAPAWQHPALVDDYNSMYVSLYTEITGQEPPKPDRVDAYAYSILRIIASESPNKMMFVKTTDYIPGINLLYIYLAIALALVPISYMVVRKQDFK